MAMAFTRVSWWLLGGSGKDARHHGPASSAGCPPSAASPDLGLRDADGVRFPPGQAAKVRSARPRRKWQSREERWRRVDREFDLVLVPSDGVGCLSGSDSEDSDWSVGWLEPHAPGFLGDGCDVDSEVEDRFAVLVRCYGRGGCDRGIATAEGSSNRDHAISAMDLIDGYSSGAEGKKYIEQWLSSLQSS